jgi:EAL domain-containing protein (putative c-di-GMP-specific phosphodiesterase class I)
VRHAVVSPSDTTLVKTIVEMGKNLSLEVVAEGIESRQQLDYLRGLDCHYGQGKLFGEPMTATEFLDLLLAQARGDAGYGRMFAGA